MAALSQHGISRICEECTKNSAAFYCECSGKKVYFCKACFPFHTDKYIDFEHRLVRADVETSDIAACRERSQALAAGRTELLQSLAAIDQCCLDLTYMVEATVQVLREYLRDQVNYLNTLRAILSADIEEAVREVENTLTVEEVDLRGKYSPYLRCYEQGSLVLFQYQLDPNFAESFRLSLPTFTLKEPPKIGENTQSDVQQLVCLGRDQVTVFDFERESWGKAIPLRNSISTFNSCSRYTGVGKSHVFCCGNHPGTTESMAQVDWLIDVAPGQVEQLPPLSIARNCPGVLHHRGELFVLGSECHADCLA